MITFENPNARFRIERGPIESVGDENSFASQTRVTPGYVSPRPPLSRLRVGSPNGTLARSSTDAGTLTPFPRTPIVASEGGLAEPPTPAAPPLDFPAVVTMVVTNVVRVPPGDDDDDPDASNLARRDRDEVSSSTFIAAGVVGGRARRPPPPGSDARGPRDDGGPELLAKPPRRLTPPAV